MTQALTMDQPLVEELNQKIERLAVQVEFLTEHAQRQQRRQQEWDELKDDLVPIGNEAFRLAVEHLEEVEHCVQIEDILHLFKRVLRNTCHMQQMLDQLESLMAFWEDFSPLTRSVFLNLMNRLDEMERKGYFAFAGTGWEVLDQVVTSFSQEDLRQLGQNAVPALEALTDLTRPEVMSMLQRSAAVMLDEETPDTSLLSIMRQMNDPAVRKGLAKALQVLKTVGEA